MYDEPMFEPIARIWRFEKGLGEMTLKRNIRILDLGCGPKIRFYTYILRRGFLIKQYVGVDPLLDEKIRRKYNKTKIVRLLKRFTPMNVKFDYIVGFAFIEHIYLPEILVNNCIELLKKGGKCIFTSPSPLSKFPLEFFAKIGLISEREIHEHKQYFDKRSLQKLVNKKNRNKIMVSHEYFEFGLNNLFVLEKK